MGQGGQVAPGKPQQDGYVEQPSEQRGQRARRGRPNRVDQVERFAAVFAPHIGEQLQARGESARVAHLGARQPIAASSGFLAQHENVYVVYACDALNDP